MDLGLEVYPGSHMPNYQSRSALITDAHICTACGRSILFTAHRFHPVHQWPGVQLREAV